MPTSPKRILCVEDDDDTCALLGMLLGIEGYEVVPRSTLDDAQELLKKEAFDLIILDMKLRDGSGIEFCHRLTAGGARTPILFAPAMQKRR
jgi:DNA-binding response OmpR family regulator